MYAPSCADSHYGDTARSLHLDILDDHDTESDVVYSGADAAAGGCARAKPQKPKRPPATELQLCLPPEALSNGQNRTVGGSSIASSAAAQLEKDLSNAAALHSRAMLAIDRISRQQSALRRFPMACPACGTLNVPPGLAWGVGDIAACQGCSQSFVPLGHGLHEGDVGLLRMAVEGLRAQNERAARLEQTLSRVQTSSRTPNLSCSSGTPAQRLSPTRHSPKAKKTLGSPRNLFYSSGFGDLTVPASTTSELCRPLSPVKQIHKPSQPELVSLIDTEDLLTNSSTGSGPCFYGRKLRHRQPTMDTLTKLQAHIPLRIGSYRRRDREDGEVSSSAPASDGEISSSGSLAGARLNRTKALHSLTRPSKSVPRLGRASALPSSVDHSTNAPQTKAGLAPEVETQIHIGGTVAELCVIGGQLLLFLAVGLVRCILTLLFGATHSAAVSAVVSAGLTSSAMASWRSAQQCLELETQRLTGTVGAANARSVFATALGKVGKSVRIQTLILPWLRIRFSVEHSLCLTISLVHLAIPMFFENWGMHGPSLYRCGAILGHVSASISFLLAAGHWLPPANIVDGSSDTNSKADLAASSSAIWLSLTFGSWASTTWAALTWWPAAAAAAAQVAIARVATDCSETDTFDMIPPLARFCFHLPLLASVILHMANIWNASRARHPLLLCTCVILAGVSVVASCSISSHLSSTALPQLPWRTTVLPVFCIMSAWKIWQELIRSLSDLT